MQRKLSLLLILILAFTNVHMHAYTFSGGNGSEGNPYLLNAPGDYLFLAQEVKNGNSFDGVFFKVSKAVLDFNGVTYTVIGTSSNQFAGTFDGNNVVIKNLTTPKGLFGYLGKTGNVTGVVIDESCIINGTMDVAGIVGVNEGTISNCVNRAEIVATYCRAGGICGDNMGTIINCKNYGNVSSFDTSASSIVGGIAGDIDGGAIIDCENYGIITGQRNWVGGIVGLMCGFNKPNNSSVTGCTNKGNVTGYFDVGGILGYSSENNALFSNNFVSGCTITAFSTNSFSRAGAILGSASNAYSNNYYTDDVIVKVGNNIYKGSTPRGVWWDDKPKDVLENKGAIVLASHSVTIHSGNGTISYDDKSTHNSTLKFFADKYSSITISIIPDVGYKLKSLKNNGVDVTNDVVLNQYTIDCIQEETILNAEFEVITEIEFDGIFYKVISNTNKVRVTGKQSSIIGEIVLPEQFQYLGTSFIVTNIESGAFNHCTELSSITIPNSVTTIGELAFSGCNGLTGTLTIPNSVTSIGSNAFYGCSDLTSVTIGNSVTSIASSTFEGCWGLTSVTIPNSITSIANNAFSRCSGLTSVTIPNSVTFIGNYAFAGCSSLTSITIPSSVTSIGNYAFTGCSSLTSVTIPSSVTSIGGGAFSGCSGLTSIIIPNSVTSIGGGAFSGCSGLTSIIIPNSVTSIGGGAFSGCSGLTSITIPNSVTTIGTQAFYDCSGLTSITIPNSVTSIGIQAFSRCSGLTSVTIPSSVTSIGNYAFSGCSSLTSITIPSSVTSIEDGVFQNCSSLTSITIPSSVTSIGEKAFEYCKSLTSVTIPNSVMSIGIVAFYSCSSLKTVISEITNPFPVNCFNNTSKATLIVPQETKSKYENLNGWKGFKEIKEEGANYSISISANGNGSASYNNTTIRGETRSFTIEEGSSATILFTPDENYGIKTVKINNSDVISSITDGSYTIDNICSNTTVDVVFESIPQEFVVDGLMYRLYESDAVEITGCQNKTGNLFIPEAVIYFGKTYQVTHIGEVAFFDYSGLTSVTIPNSVTSIGDEAFQGCSGLTSITIGNSVTSIGDEAFSGCSGLTSVTIGNSITSIGNSAFQFCSGLTSVTIGNSVTSIGDYAFYCCDGLTSITIPNSVTSIGEYSFGCCSGLTSITIPNSVTSIGAFAFKDCFLNTIVVESGNTHYDSRNDCNAIIETASNTLLFGCNNTIIPHDVTSIGECAFRGYSDLTSVTIPNSVTSIGAEAFFWCSGLTSITIPNSVTSIGDSAFAACFGLTSITIPNSITSIGNSAFAGCRGLKNVISEITNPFTVKCFDNTSNLTLIVPRGTKSKYENLSGWNGFKEIKEEGVNNYSISITVNDNGWASYNNTTIKGETRSFTLEEGASAKILFTPDDGYRIKSVKVNNAIVTVSGNLYTINNVSANTTVSVEFEAIPITTYTLSVTATGNGAVVYNSNSVRSKTTSFTLNEGTSATISFSPDNGYHIASVKLNDKDVTANVANNQYIISNITANAKLDVTFEAIPPTTYTLSITSSGNGSVTYNNTAVRNNTRSFTINEGTSASVSISPDDGYRIASVILNGKDVTSAVTNSQYNIGNINDDTNLSVTFETIPIVTYTLSIRSTGNGSASYDGTTIQGTANSFTVNEGTDATIAFTPNEGYQIKDVKVDNAVVVVVNNQYTIRNITKDTSVEVIFEEIPQIKPEPTTYTLMIKATGNGAAKYHDAEIRGKTTPFTIEEGANATITFTADEGYRIKEVKVNGEDVTSSITDNTCAINNIGKDTSVEVAFEEIPQIVPEPATYTLTIKATGNGSTYYGQETVKDGTGSFTVVEGTSATIAFSPEHGHRIKSVMVNGSAVSIDNNQYTIDDIKGDMSVEVEFEAIPVTTYTLSVKASGNGSASFDGTTVKAETATFIVNEGSTAILSFSPDNGNSVSVVMLNGKDITDKAMNNRVVIDEITQDISFEVVFKEDINALTVDGINYKVVSQSEKTVMVVGGDYGQVLTIPATVSQDGTTWKVTGIEKDALKDIAALCAVIWEPEAPFTADVSNPNLLLYVKDTQYAPPDIKNVVVNGSATSITLVDANGGNSFFSPQAFTAQKISYTHHYGMITGIGESRGWETIALPFDVQTVTHAVKGTCRPFANWKSGDDARPFWLYELTSSGFAEATGIEAYTPYVISMPNHEKYKDAFILSGNITFAATNTVIKKTEDVKTVTYGDRTFVPCFNDKTADLGLYALNVNNDWAKNNSGMTDGSRFVLNMRKIHPFEAYMVSTSNASRWYFDIFERATTAIKEIEKDLFKDEQIYDLQGRKTLTPHKKGIYVTNGKKLIVR